jgi:hypothetical protein
MDQTGGSCVCMWCAVMGQRLQGTFETGSLLKIKILTISLPSTLSLVQLVLTVLSRQPFNLVLCHRKRVSKLTVSTSKKQNLLSLCVVCVCVCVCRDR